MSGHSRWAKIKHTKGAADAKRGKIFTKLIREITTSARIGGGDMNGNSRLRKAVEVAKAANMPGDTIDRALKKGTGELEGAQIEEIGYEGYGPGGVAILIQVMTDNKNRTVAEIRHMLAKYNGNMASAGAVAWVFEDKGVLYVPKGAASEDKLMELTLDAGAQEISDAGDEWEIQTDPGAYDAVKAALDGANVSVARGEVTKLPKNSVKVSGPEAATTLRLIEALEDHDDVQHVFANFDIAEEEMARLSA